MYMRWQPAAVRHLFSLRSARTRSCVCSKGQIITTWRDGVTSTQKFYTDIVFCQNNILRQFEEYNCIKNPSIFKITNIMIFTSINKTSRNAVYQVINKCDYLRRIRNSLFHILY